MRPELLSTSSLTPPHADEAKATVDFESRSACSIKRGAYIYSLHPTTEVMCLAFRLPYWEKGRVELWHPAYPHLDIEEDGQGHLPELFAWIALGGLVEAHNAFFERCMWANQCVPKLGWPEVPAQQWRCSAAKCAVHALPRSLEKAGIALNVLEQKDLAGSKVMRKLCKPRKVLKKEREQMQAAWQRWQDGEGPFAPHPDDAVLWHESVEDFQTLWTYCKQDVRAEEAISHLLADLSPDELKVWLMDQAMNWRGITCDTAMAQGALRIAARYVDALNAELREITGNDEISGTNRAAVMDWLQTQGLAIYDTQGTTIDKLRKLKGLKPNVGRVLFILREVNRTSTAKFKAAMDTVGPDGRIRDMMMYHGAGTGRWSGKGLQPHNFPKGKFDSNERIGMACEVIREGDLQLLQALYGSNVMEVLSWSLRGLLTASEGKVLYVADFAAIEARVVLWLAQQMNALQVFYDHQCIYCDMATGIYGYQVVKGVHKKERQFGKQAILGLGFEMGFVKFLVTCRKYDITFTPEMARRIVGSDWETHVAKILAYFEGQPTRRKVLLDNEWDLAEVMHELVLMRHVVLTYRARYPEVAQMWRDQEQAAIAAVRSPGRRVSCDRGRNTWVVEGDFLKTYLPSGRPLHYPEPRIVMKSVPWDKNERRPNLTFLGENSLSKKLERQQAYGGLLVENITQATARDLMAHAMVLCDEHQDYLPLISVHDELVAEAVRGTGSVMEFEEMMATTPYWAKGCPVEAEGWVGDRYRK